MARTDMGAPLPTCFFPTVRTSITRWSRLAGAGGIEGMLREIRRWKG